MLRHLLRLTIASLLLGALAWPAHAQDAGRITGKVSEKRTGHAVPFATVTVVGTGKGALTDSEGQFIITGVPPGAHEVKVQFLGFRPMSSTVEVRPGGAATANFQLEEIVVVQEKAIEVTAERKLVEVRQGATIRSVDAN